MFFFFLHRVRCYSNLTWAPVCENRPVIWTCWQHLYPFRGTASLLRYSMLFCVLLIIYCTTVARTHTHTSTHARTPSTLLAIMAQLNLQKYMSPFLHFPVKSFGILYVPLLRVILRTQILGHIDPLWRQNWTLRRIHGRAQVPLTKRHIQQLIIQICTEAQLIKAAGLMLLHFTVLAVLSSPNSGYLHF